MFVALMGSFALMAFFQDLAFGVAYSFAAAPLIVFVLVYSGGLRRVDQVGVCVTAIALWSFFLIRPLFLYSHPFLFKFIGLYRADLYLQVDALYWVGLCNWAMLGSTAALLRLFCKIRTESLFRPDELLPQSGKLLKLLAVCGVIYLIASVLAAGAGGRLLAMIELVLPVKYIAPFSMAVLVSSPSRLSSSIRYMVFFTLATYILSQLAQGSKSFLLELAFMSIVMVLIRRGNFRVSTQKLVRFGLIAVVLAVSFPLAMSVRRLSQGGGLGGFSLFDVIERIQLMSAGKGPDGQLLVFGADLITRRLNGFDGSLAAIQIPARAVPEVFSVNVMVVNALASIIPGFQSSFESFGQAASRIFFPYIDADVSHGGAIGSFAMLGLFAKNDPVASIFSVALYGCVWASLFTFSARVKIPMPVRYGIVGGLALTFSISTSGGNFDRSFRDLFVLLMHMVLLTYYLKLGTRFRVRDRTVFKGADGPPPTE